MVFMIDWKSCLWCVSPLTNNTTYSDWLTHIYMLSLKFMFHLNYEVDQDHQSIFKLNFNLCIITVCFIDFFQQSVLPEVHIPSSHTLWSYICSTLPRTVWPSTPQWSRSIVCHLKVKLLQRLTRLMLFKVNIRTW